MNEWASGSGSCVVTIQWTFDDLCTPYVGVN